LVVHYENLVVLGVEIHRVIMVCHNCLWIKCVWSYTQILHIYLCCVIEIFLMCWISAWNCWCDLSYHSLPLIQSFCNSEMKKPHVTSLGVVPAGIRLVEIRLCISPLCFD